MNKKTIMVIFVGAASMFLGNLAYAEYQKRQVTA